MPIEIRELIIKTVVQNEVTEEKKEERSVDSQILRKEILDECRRMISEERFWGGRSR